MTWTSWASPAASLKLPVYVGVWCAALVYPAFYVFTQKIFYTGERDRKYVTLSEYTTVGLFHETIYKKDVRGNLELKEHGELDDYVTAADDEQPGPEPAVEAA